MLQDSHKPLITIVTLTYNKFDKIADTILSVLEQDYCNIEYIICDDGSNEFPKATIDSIIDRAQVTNVECKIITHEQNQGTVKNINSAYKEGNGDYFINLSCGDVFFNTTVVTSIYERFRQTEAKVLCTTRLGYIDHFQPQFYLPHIKMRPIIEKRDTPEEQRKAIVLRESFDMASGSAMSFSRKTIEEMGYFDENYVLWEDGPFLAKFLKQDKLEFAYDIVSIWYGLDGISSSESKQRHPLLQADTEKFNEYIMKESMENLSGQERKRLLYRNEYDKCLSHHEKARVAVKFLPQFIYDRCVLYRKKIARRYDQRAILKRGIEYKNREI